MISTKNLSCMQDVPGLQKLCRSIAALELIMAEEFYLRYYSYNLNWSKNEEVFEMNDGRGRYMLILFHPYGSVVSGIDGEFYDFEKNYPKIENLTNGLPDIFHEFMYEEPVKSLKSTFCIWSVDGITWQKSDVVDFDSEDGSEEMLSILDGNPMSYVDFCEWYYEKEVPIDIVEDIYNGKEITLNMIRRLNSDREDIGNIRAELCEMRYPNTL